MALQGVVIDEGTRQRGSEAQREEWNAIVHALLAKGAGLFEEDTTLHVTVTEQELILEFLEKDGRSRGRVAIAHELLSTHITEYVDIVRQIANAESINQMEALDMAKKVTHDRAGRLLKRELRDFGFDLEASRRLFTLLLSLRVDTTRLTGIHGHRRIR